MRKICSGNRDQLRLRGRLSDGRTVRAAIDAVPSRLAPEPEFDIDNYAREIVTVFDLATRIEARHDP